MANAPNATSVERTLAVLECLESSRRGLNISEISRKLGIPKSSTHVIVLTLERLGYPDVDVRQHTSTSEPAEAMLEVARHAGADLIVVGNQGMRRRVLGSIPNSVSHRATCDVLIVQTG